MATSRRDELSGRNGQTDANGRRVGNDRAHEEEEERRRQIREEFERLIKKEREQRERDRKQIQEEGTGDGGAEIDRSDTR